MPVLRPSKQIRPKSKLFASLATLAQD